MISFQLEKTVFVGVTAVQNHNRKITFLRIKSLRLILPEIYNAALLFPPILTEKL